jgi:hypothetical protein
MDGSELQTPVPGKRATGSATTSKRASWAGHGGDTSAFTLLADLQSKVVRAQRIEAESEMAREESWTASPFVPERVPMPRRFATSIGTGTGTDLCPAWLLHSRTRPMCHDALLTQATPCVP